MNEIAHNENIMSDDAQGQRERCRLHSMLGK